MLDQGNAPEFDARIYGKIALNDLVTYSVYYLTKIGEEITAEQRGRSKGESEERLTRQGGVAGRQSAKGAECESLGQRPRWASND